MEKEPDKPNKKPAVESAAEDQKSVNPDDGNSHTDNTAPLYENLTAYSLPHPTAEEVAGIYEGRVQDANSALNKLEKKTTPPCLLEAPSLADMDTLELYAEDLVDGVSINIPRSPKLWTGDQITLRWGMNTFYSTLDKPSPRDLPRMVHCITGDQLAHYPRGEVDVYYEVVRGSRLVGVSANLKLTIVGTGHPKGGNRRYLTRRRKP